VQVDTLAFDVEEIAGLAGAEEVASEHFPQTRDHVSERANRCLGRPAGPELLDQTVGGDNLAGVKQQQRQEGALLPPLQLERASLHPDLEWAEDAELD
jgi:hypothetical protein